MQEAEKIWMNGALVDWPDAHVHVLSHGLHYGTTVFEGIRSYDAEGGTAVFRLGDHLARLERSAAMYHMPIPYTREELRAAVHPVIAVQRPRRLLHPADRLARLRHDGPVPARGARRRGRSPRGSGAPTSARRACSTGIRAKVSSWRRIGSSTIPATAKAGGQYLNSILAKIETHKAGYQEAILLNEAGFVADGSGENLFLVRDGVLITPAGPGLDPRGHHPRQHHRARRRRGHPGARARGRPRRALHRRRGVHHRHRRRGLPGQRGRRPPARPPRADHPRLQERFFAATEGRDPRSAEWLDYVGAAAPALSPLTPVAERVVIYDTTLRDGMQREGLSLCPSASSSRSPCASAEFGVDYIEAGFPASNPKYGELFGLLEREDLGATRLAAFGMTRRRGIAAERGPGHARPGRELRPGRSRSSARPGTSTSRRSPGSTARRTCG